MLGWEVFNRTLKRINFNSWKLHLAHVKETLLLLFANMMNGEQLTSMMDKNKYFIMQNVFHCWVCKSETITSTARQPSCCFHWLAGVSFFLSDFYFFFLAAMFENNFWYLTETKITISFPHQSIEPIIILPLCIFVPWNIKSKHYEEFTGRKPVPQNQVAHK